MNRRIVTSALCVATAGLLAGCGGHSGGGGTSSTAGARKSHPAAPIVSQAQAAAILTHYDTVNNEANKTQDAKKLSTVEGGALFQQSSAQYDQFPTYSAKDKSEYRLPWHHVEPRFYIPTSGTWFMASSRATGVGFSSTDRKLMVFRKESGGWKMVSDALYHGTLPALAHGADGAPEVVASTATVGTTKLSGLGAAVDDLRISGGKKTGAVLADSAVKRAAVKEYTNRNTHWGTHKSCEQTEFDPTSTKYDNAYTTHPDLFALKTADGGALTVFTSYYVQLDFSTRPGTCTVSPNGVYKAYIHQSDVNGVRARYATLNAVEVARTGKATQLVGDVQLLGASV